MTSRNTHSATGLIVHAPAEGAELRVRWASRAIYEDALASRQIEIGLGRTEPVNFIAWCLPEHSWDFTLGERREPL